MRKRRRLLIAALGVALVATFFLPPVYWRVVGWVKGEAFYNGRPTSFWEKEIREGYFPYYRKTVNASGELVDDQGGWTRRSSSLWYEFLLPKPKPTQVAIEQRVPLLDGDMTAIPVLLELIDNKDAKIRWVAVWGLGTFDSKETVRAIETVSEDPDEGVRRAVRRAREFDRMLHPTGE